MIEVPHRFMQSAEGRVEIGTGLLQRRVAEHVLHVVHGPTGFKQAGATFMPEVWKCRLIGRYAASDSGLSLVLPLSFGSVFFFQIQAGL